MVVAGAEMRIHAVVVQQEAHMEEVVFQERFGWFLQLGLYVLLYKVMAGGLCWPTALACSATMSLTTGTLGPCSPWCSVD